MQSLKTQKGPQTQSVLSVVNYFTEAVVVVWEIHGTARNEKHGDEHDHLCYPKSLYMLSISVEGKILFFVVDEPILSASTASLATEADAGENARR